MGNKNTNDTAVVVRLIAMLLALGIEIGAIITALCAPESLDFLLGPDPAEIFDVASQHESKILASEESELQWEDYDSCPPVSGDSTAPEVYYEAPYTIGHTEYPTVSEKPHIMTPIKHDKRN